MAATITFFAAPSTAPPSSAGAVRPPTFALYTLGCKVNQYDSHQIARALVANGFRRVEFRETADLYVIDTCTVTAEADRKSRKAAGRAQRNNPDAVVAVTGCAAVAAADQFRRLTPQALVLGNAQKFDLPRLALEALGRQTDWAARYAAYRAATGSEPVPTATRERAVLKIQDGCNHRCAFCIIPSVRGASVARPRAVLLDEARAFVREGARELVVTGVSMGDWGHTPETSDDGSSRGRRGNAELCALLRAVTTIEGLERVRVSSLDPADVDDEFLQTVATQPGICPHLHLALQAGGAATLRRMKRRYTPEHFLNVARRWREIRPDGGLTTDIIVGFPGETDADFECSLEIARAARFSAIHVFPYSPRPGTAAAEMVDMVPPDVQKKRVAALLQLADELAAEYAAQFIGQTVPVLAEATQPGAAFAEGLTPHYVKAVVAKAGAAVATGDIVWLRVEGWRGGALYGTQVGTGHEAFAA